MQSTYLLLLQNVQEWHHHCPSPLAMHLPALSIRRKTRGSEERIQRDGERWWKAWLTQQSKLHAEHQVISWFDIHFSFLKICILLAVNYSCADRICVYIQAMLDNPAVPFELQHVLEPYHHWHEDDNSLPPVKIVLKQSQHFTRTKDTVFILQAYEKSWLHKMCLCDANNSSIGDSMELRVDSFSQY